VDSLRPGDAPWVKQANQPNSSCFHIIGIASSDGVHIDVAASFSASETRTNKADDIFDGRAQAFWLDFLQGDCDFQIEEYAFLVFFGKMGILGPQSAADDSGYVQE
jgi:hypothetical protein